MANQEREENEGLWAVAKAVHPNLCLRKLRGTLKGAQNSVQPWSAAQLPAVQPSLISEKRWAQTVNKKNQNRHNEELGLLKFGSFGGEQKQGDFWHELQIETHAQIVYIKNVQVFTRQF